MSGLVSICIPCFNQGRYLAAAIDSALAQTAAAVEVIASDNASTDETAAVVAGFAGTPRFRGLSQPATLPMTRHWNVFREQARGEWLLFLCADDVLRPDCVARCLTVAEAAPDAACVFFEYGYLDETGAVSAKPAFYQASALIPARRQFVLFLRGNNFPLTACLVRRSALDRCGWFNEAYAFSSDWYMWLALCLLQPDGMVGYAAEPLALYRRHSGTETLKGLTAMIALDEIERMKAHFIARAAGFDAAELREVARQGNLKLAGIYEKAALDLNRADVAAYYRERAEQYRAQAPQPAPPAAPPLAGPPFPLPEGSRVVA